MRLLSRLLAATWPCVMGLCCATTTQDRSRTDKPAPASSATTPSPEPEASEPESPALAPVTVVPRPNPLAGVSDARIDELLVTARDTLPTASIGSANRGALFNGVQMQSSTSWEIMVPDRAWATPETIASLRRAVTRVETRHPGSPRLRIGDLSRKGGGYIRPHRSHQSGRDVDLGYYYAKPASWYTKATRDNLDCARTWTFIKALATGGDLEYVFMDRSVQLLLREHAEAIGEDPNWLDEDVFERRDNKHRALVRHTWGHRTHFHVRLFNNQARAAARRLYPRLRAHRILR